MTSIQAGMAKRQFQRNHAAIITIQSSLAAGCTRDSLPVVHAHIAELRQRLESGILNLAINALLSRVRHTNMLVIVERGFPYWPMIETKETSKVPFGSPTNNRSTGQ